ncbi:MAG: tetratricopeptide repeat protein [Myxococcales bacterium]|nr:tetratricopeptide repeat protein [Myxococcales bacterium]
MLELAEQLRREGQFAEARARFEHALDALLAFDRASAAQATARPRADARDGLGRALANLGELEAALAQHERARELRVASLGPRDVSIAASDLLAGAALEALQRPREAEAAYRRALTLRMRALADHPDTARAYNSLARALYYQHRFDEALALHQEALRIRRAQLGEQHPDTATSYNNIGAVYRAMGDNERALEQFERALEIRRATVGEQHPYTAISYNNIAELLELEGDELALTRALELHRAALAIRERFFGEQHAETARSDHNLGRLLAALGQREAAREHLRRALETRVTVLGPDHPETRSSRRALAELDGEPSREPTLDPQELTAPEVTSPR